MKLSKRNAHAPLPDRVVVVLHEGVDLLQQARLLDLELQQPVLVAHGPRRLQALLRQQPLLPEDLQLQLVLLDQHPTMQSPSVLPVESALLLDQLGLLVLLHLDRLQDRAHVLPAPPLLLQDPLLLRQQHLLLVLLLAAQRLRYLLRVALRHVDPRLSPLPELDLSFQVAMVFHQALHSALCPQYLIFDIGAVPLLDLDGEEVVVGGYGNIWLCVSYAGG